MAVADGAATVGTLGDKMTVSWESAWKVSTPVVHTQGKARGGKGQGG